MRPEDPVKGFSWLSLRLGVALTLQHCFACRPSVQCILGISSPIWSVPLLYVILVCYSQRTQRQSQLPRILANSRDFWRCGILAPKIDQQLTMFSLSHFG
jgi:hypothetical protein